jgi:hypothetical protein
MYKNTMLHSAAKNTMLSRQSPLDKMERWGENAMRLLGTAKGVYDAGRTVYNLASAAAPYLQAGMAML